MHVGKTAGGSAVEFLRGNGLLLFAAHMRLPYDMSNSKKAQRAANAIRLLGLEKCENTIIGSSIEWSTTTIDCSDAAGRC